MMELLALFFIANTKAFALTFVASLTTLLCLELLHYLIGKYRKFTERRHGGYVSVNHLKSSREARIWDFINTFYYNHINSASSLDLVMLLCVMIVSVLGMMLGVCLV